MFAQEFDENSSVCGIQFRKGAIFTFKKYEGPFLFFQKRNDF